MGAMRRPLLALEARLLRKGVQRLVESRAECAGCGRTPLVGERVHDYGDGTMVCSLCRPARRGEPERSRLVLHSELGHAVKPLSRVSERVAA